MTRRALVTWPCQVPSVNSVKDVKSVNSAGESVKLSDLKGSFMVYEAWSLCVPRTRSREEKMRKLKPQRGHLLESDIRSAALKCSPEKHYVAHKNSSNKGASRVYVSIDAYNHMHRFMQKSLALTEKINCILVKGSLEVKLPTIWRDEKQRRHRCVFYIVTSKFVSRHSGVQFFHIPTSKSSASMVCFVHFDLKMCFAP